MSLIPKHALLNVWHSVLNKSQNVRGYDNALRTMDFLVEVSRGNIPGSKPAGSYGERTTAGPETNRVIWPNGVFTLPPAAGVQMSIVSTNAADDLTGTNVRKVEIHYLDADLNEQAEIVDMDGTTPVLTTATDIRFINCLHIHEYGTVAQAAGDITASNGGTIYSQISTGEVRCSSSARMVPAGKKIFVMGAVAGSVSGTAAAGTVVRIVASELDNHIYTGNQFMLVSQGSIGIQDGSEAFNFLVPFPFNAGTVIALTLTTDKAATISGSWFGWEENLTPTGG